MSIEGSCIPPVETPTRQGALNTLRVNRDDRRKQILPSRARALVVAWNALCQAGTKVRFYPLWGDWQRFRVAEIVRPASILPSGEPVLWLANVSGCVAARHCEPAELHEPLSPLENIRPLEEDAAEDLDAERIADEIMNSGAELLPSVERAAAAERGAPEWLAELLDNAGVHHGP